MFRASTVEARGKSVGRQANCLYTVFTVLSMYLLFLMVFKIMFFLTFLARI